MMSGPLIYSKNPQKKKPNEELKRIFEKNFNQLNHPIRCAESSSGPSNSSESSDAIKWPLKAMKGQPFFYGYLNEQIGQVEIYDDSALLLLNWLGNYGNCYFLDNLLIGSKSNQFNEKRVHERLKKEDSLRQAESSSSTTLAFLSNPSNLFELNQDNYRQNLHADAFNGLHEEYGQLDVNQLIGRLYKGASKEQLNDPVGKKQFNNFEDTFVQLKNSFNQNFIDREEYLLKLDLEEALFLKQAFGILSVQEFVREDESGDTRFIDRPTKDPTRDLTKSLSLTSLWTRCIQLAETRDECFITKYAAYFYFRSKGFVVKNGTKFGSDFVLYTRNPMYVHSNYSVLLIKRPADDERRALRFANVQAFMRMTKCVVKVG